MSSANRIVVVDDNAAALKATTRLLKRAGYEVHTADTGHGALELIRERKPELVLLDVNLPDIMGPEILKEIRSAAELQTISVVFLSATQVAPEHQAIGLDSGADGYLARPISNQELLARVRLHLRQRELTEQLRASEQRYRDMVEHLPDIVFVNRDDHIIYINPAGVTLLRAKSESDILGRSPFDFIHPDFHEMVRERIGRARREPTAIPVAENCFVALDGTHIAVEVMATSYRSGAGMDLQVIARDIGPRKLAETERQELLAREQAAKREALEASRYYRALFESAPGCYLVLTPGDCEIVAVSEAYLRATLTTREELSGRKLFDAFADHEAGPDPGAAARLRASLERVARTKQADVLGVECYPISRPESQGGGFQDRCWSIVHSPVLGPDHEVAYIIHRVEDVTEYLLSLPDRESANQFLASRTEMMEADIVLRSRELDEIRLKLERSQALLRVASDLAQLGAWAVDLPDVGLTWSEEVYQIHEVPVGAPLEVRYALEFYAPEYRETIRSAFQACVEHGIPYDLELQIVTAKGRRIWIRTMGQAVRDGSGQIVRVQGAFQDISRRKDAEAREGELQERLTGMLERIGEGFLALDHDWYITYVNAEAERIVERERESLLGQTLWEAFPGVAGSRFEEEYLRAVRDSVAVSFEEYFQPLDAWIEVRAYPSDEGLAIYFRDVTLERKFEEQIQQSQRLEAVGQLTGGVAHDFNNLLTVIIGNAELLGEKLDPATPMGVLVGLISTAAQRGAKLTSALLSFARRQALDPVAVDVNELLRGMHDLLRRTLGEDIDIEFRMSDGLRAALVDPAQFESAILNLCLNARDAMEQGGRLTIETGLRELGEEYVDTRLGVNPGEYILVAVSDTGCGIPPEHIPRLFEPFFTTKEKGKGTGLGLPMVYGFVRQSGGQVNVYSEVGEGTTVKMYLPMADEGVVAPSIARTAGEHPRGSEKILLVEDDDMVRLYAEDLLSGLGYKVTVAANGPDALAILEARADFDLLFTDIVMPGGMNGRQLAEQATTMRPGLKVLYTSGYTENAIVHHGRLDAGVDLLSKPYRRAELAAKIRELLDRPAPQEGQS